MVGQRKRGLIKIMRQLLAIALLSSLAGMISTPSVAAETIQAKSGKQVLVAGVTDWDGRCRAKSEYASVVITRKPKYGVIKVQPGVKLPIPKTEYSGKCTGKKIRGVAVYYTPRKGYKGLDWVKFKARPFGSKRWYYSSAKIRVQR